ncbi:hypothetical protein MBLNU457_g2675t1 [Dothideomycetes sp. NU457]
MSSKSPPADTALDLVIRFTTSAPDLVVTIATPNYTSALSLKQEIRTHLPSETAAHRLRLISAGRVLADTNAIAKSINIPPPPPKQQPTTETNDKGKAPLRSSSPSPPNARVYVHCSVGDALTTEELEAEAAAAEEADAALLSKTQQAAEAAPRLVDTSSRTTAGPRGFDRLLNAGFSQAEVATLRTQFLAIQAHTHTPDTMPTGDDLRALEDRWLDNDATGSGPAAGGGDGDGSFGAEDGGLEDMLWGNIMGFFWPIAAVCWLMREEGVWSRRRQIAVLSGMLVNLTFGFLRLTN